MQPCPFGTAYVQFGAARDRDRFVSRGPVPFDDVQISFVKHNEGSNWCRANFNHECWVMLVGPPLDNWNTDDINAIFNKIGKVILWEKDPTHKERIIGKVRVTDVIEIPKSIRFTEGDLPESES
jgi:hypothetical protein